MVSTPWPERLDPVAQRYDLEYERNSPQMPDFVQALPVYQEWVTGHLASRIASPFWAVGCPKKRDVCLDLGCGPSFMVYPWREWDARFYGQDISSAICKMVNARGSQLNSKLFQGMRQAPAHLLGDFYEPEQFDWVIATGWSCYYEWDYWALVLERVRPLVKPGGAMIFDVVDPETPLAEDWAILETYLGAEVELTDLKTWRSRLKGAGLTVKKEQPGELFHLFKVVF